jgi:hypothetical protein
MVLSKSKISLKLTEFWRIRFCRLGLTGGAQPVFVKQLRFDPTVIYGAPIKKYAETTPSADGVFSIFRFLAIVLFECG